MHFAQVLSLVIYLCTKDTSWHTKFFYTRLAGDTFAVVCISVEKIYLHCFVLKIMPKFCSFVINP